MAETSRVRTWLLRRVAIVSAVALAAGGMLVLEQTGPSAANGQKSPVHVTSTHKSPSTKSSHNEKHKHKHCDDGHGKDNKKNKHCRPPSGS